MGAHNFSLRDDSLIGALGEEPDQCFFCGSALSGISVYWNGNVERPRNLFLHPVCAQELACHLISDAHKAKHMEKQMFRRLPGVAA